MRFAALIFVSLMTVSTVASARDIAGCAALYKQLNSVPQNIGNTQAARQHAQIISRLNADIRALRIDMRRSGCGGGSIVIIGRSSDKSCQPMRQSLESLENERDALNREREETRRNGWSSVERAAILSEIRNRACIPSDMEEDRKARMKVQGIALPRAEASPRPYAAVTPFGSHLKAPVPIKPVEELLPLPGPERPYEPDRQVRMVGPIFLPEQSLDLANPKSSGPQQTE